MRRLAPLLLALLVLLTACHRLARPASTYTVEVENRTDRIMVVSFDDGRGVGILGSVRAGSSERFILSDVAAPRITITARSDDGSRTSGPYSLALTAASTGTSPWSSPGDDPAAPLSREA